MRFLILTQYYPPETGAPQNRLSGLARELKKMGEEVTILTAMPNYPQMKIHREYRGKFCKSEILNDIAVHRSWIYTGSKRNIFSRLLNYFSFVFTSWIISFRIKGKIDFVLCESPPLFLGITAVLIARRKKAGLIFNVSDLWPESAEKLGLVKNKYILKTAYSLEKWLYNNSVIVTGQTKGICKDILKRFPRIRTHWLPNGIDEDRFNPLISSDWRLRNGYLIDDFIVLYAGIIGYAQGLECIIHSAELLIRNKSIHFAIVGDGPEKEKLLRLTEQLKISNVRFFNGVPGNEIPAILKSIDAAVIPLKKLDLFTGAIPSKIFESLAMEKPILLGVEGEAKEIFIDNGKCGIDYIPEDPACLSKAVLEMYNNPELVKQLGKNGRTFVLNEFGRRKITSDFLKKLFSTE